MPGYDTLRDPLIAHFRREMPMYHIHAAGTGLNIPRADKPPGQAHPERTGDSGRRIWTGSSGRAQMSGAEREESMNAETVATQTAQRLVGPN